MTLAGHKGQRFTSIVGPLSEMSISCRSFTRPSTCRGDQGCNYMHKLLSGDRVTESGAGTESVLHDVLCS